MGPQFVDLDADGCQDIFTATYDGSVHVAYGTESGFAQPEHLLNGDGGRIGLKMMWDKEAGRWAHVFKAQCTTAVALDWEGDGALDILMGCYNTGNVFLCRNEGEADAPVFSATYEEVLAGDESFALPGGATMLRPVDWDGDGLVDLVCGSFGEKDGSVLGGVYLFRNVGKKGAPTFAKAEALVAPLKSPAKDAPSRGLYADPVDYDGDGDLDLLVGGKAEAAGIWLYRQK